MKDYLPIYQIIEVSKEERARNMEERQHQLRIKVQKSALPKISYRIECFNCNREYSIDLAGKGNLSNDQINAYLTANGWIIGSRGYECPKCFNGWVQAVVEYVRGNEEEMNVVESDTSIKGIE